MMFLDPTACTSCHGAVHQCRLTTRGDAPRNEASKLIVCSLDFSAMSSTHSPALHLQDRREFRCGGSVHLGGVSTGQK
jgi:hypothetical protein